MMQNFKGKKPKDIETAAESIIFNTAFSTKTANGMKVNTSPSITNQQINYDNFDTYIEKKQ